VIRFLTLAEVLELHRLVVEAAGGALVLRDLGALEAAVAQPQASFDGQPLYPDVPAMAATLCFSIVANHPFIDGNKRTGHAAMETFLWLNGLEILASVDDQESIMLAVAAGRLGREHLHEWLIRHCYPRQQS
jgi:death on curing protein